MRPLETEIVPSHVLGYQAPTKQDGESSLLIYACSTQGTLEGKLRRKTEAVVFWTHYSQGLKVRMEFRKTQTMNYFLCKTMLNSRSPISPRVAGGVQIPREPSTKEETLRLSLQGRCISVALFQALLTMGTMIIGLKD